MTPFAQLEKYAATRLEEGLPQNASEEQHERAKRTLKNRHLALILKRALQGGAMGGMMGGIGAAGNDGGMTGGEGALAGLLAGGLGGGAIGAAEGAGKRALGLDPLLQTMLVSRST